MQALFRSRVVLIPLVLGFFFSSEGCFRGPRVAAKELRHAAKPLARLGYTIQAGAFAQVENAVRLSESLQAQGLEATYYASAQGLYRVRFGDFPTKEAARMSAAKLL